MSSCCDSDRVEFGGLEEFRSELLVKTDPVPGYIVLRRVNLTGSPSNLGRREFNRHDLAQYRVEPSLASTFDKYVPGGPADAVAEHELLVDAVCRWIVATAETEAEVTNEDFVLSPEVRAVKGVANLLNPSIRIRRKGRVPSASELGIRDEESRTWGQIHSSARQALGVAQYSLQISRECASSSLTLVTEAARIQSSTHQEMVRNQETSHKSIVDGLHRIVESQQAQLDAAYKFIDELNGELLSVKVDISQLGMTSQSTAAEREVREKLGQQAIEQFGKLGEAWVNSKGLIFDPELMPVLEVIAGDLALRAALKRPDVLAFLRNDQLRALFVQTLIETAESMAKPPPTSN